jgi:hypothetical protein
MDSALSKVSVGFDKKIAERSGKLSLYLDQIDMSSGNVPRNLIVKNNSVNPTHQIDITCERIRIAGFLVEGISVTVDIEVVGANGRDEGEERSSAWYYLWLVFKNSGDTVAGLLSTNRETPIMPMGFTEKRLIGVVRNDDSGDFLEFAQVGRDVFYNEGGAAMQVVSNGNATVFTAVDCREVFPNDVAHLMYLNFTGRDPAGDNSVVIYIRPNGLSNYNLYFQMDALDSTVVNRIIGTEYWMVCEDGFIEYAMSQSSEQGNIYVIGYQLMLW